MTKEIAKKALSTNEINNDKIVEKIYLSFESELNEKNKEIARLRKQIARGHDVGCDCSFCKMPSFIYGSVKC